MTQSGEEAGGNASRESNITLPLTPSSSFKVAVDCFALTKRSSAPTGYPMRISYAHMIPSIASSPGSTAPMRLLVSATMPK